jgi:hypothetical protein
MIEFDDKNFDK